ncbi:MAG: ATP-binding protein [Candidatus Paceibacterota bacterium]
MNNEDQILEDSIFKIGKVVSVDGRTIRIKVDKMKNSSHLLYKGDLLKNISVGGYIKIIKGFTKIIGKVDGEFTTEDLLFTKKEYTNDKGKINRVLAVSLLGFLKGKTFERGIKELPLVGNECFLLHNDEFNQVHNFIRGGDDPIKLGRLALEKGQDISVGVNSLLASHIGIFGNTGSGKSYTLAKIYYELFKKYKEHKNFQRNANFFLLDFNGEYVGENERDQIIVEAKYKKVFKLSTRIAGGQDKFPISKETLEDPIFWIIFLEATEKTQGPFIRRSLESSFTNELLNGSHEEISTKIHNLIFNLIKEIIDNNKDREIGIKVFSEFLYDLKMSTTNLPELNDVILFFTRRVAFNGTTGSYYVNGQDGINGNDRYSKENIQTYILSPLEEKINTLQFDLDNVSSIRLKIIIKYYDEIIKGYSNREHIAPLIKRLETRIKDLSKVVVLEESSEIREEDTLKFLTIVSFKDVNIQIRKMLPLLLCRNLYEEKKRMANGITYLNIIVDEAHNILSNVSERENEQWKDYRLETFEEIIKEGRKFGVFLTLASQRPADISPTILSQLHNYFLHRLINNNDIYAVEKTIAYLDKVSFDYLPILPTGTCILAGILAQVPVVVDIGEIPAINAPRNQTMTLVEKWGK